MAGFGSVPMVGSGSKGPLRADEIDYFIRGHEMQYVELELDPGESAIAEAGVMMFKDPSVAMDTVFGDASKPQTAVKSLSRWVLSIFFIVATTALAGAAIFVVAYTAFGTTLSQQEMYTLVPVLFIAIALIALWRSRARRARRNG